MTQIVTVLCCEHRFQYVERRYSGFVALSFVVATDTGLDAIENQRVKTASRNIDGRVSVAQPRASKPLNPAN
jgi:hypothetical protein